MEQLSQILWRERELLETLAYRLEVERLLLSSGQTRWLINANRDINATLEEIRLVEAERADAADRVAGELGLAPNPSLMALADHAPSPWPEILRDHHAAMVTAAREIADKSEEARGLISAGARSARETLLAIGGGTAASYTPAGVAVNDAPRTHLIDRSL